MTVSDNNKAVVRACFEAGVNGHLHALDTIISPAFVLHDPAGPDDVRGLEAFKALVEAYRAGLPDLQITIEQQLADGDHVAARLRARGTHTGELMGVPPSGRPVTLAGVTISRCHDGRIVEEWEDLRHPRATAASRGSPRPARTMTARRRTSGEIQHWGVKAHARRARFGWPLFVFENARDNPAIEQLQAFLRALHAALGEEAS